MKWLVWVTVLFLVTAKPEVKAAESKTKTTSKTAESKKKKKSLNSKRSPVKRKAKATKSKKVPQKAIINEKSQPTKTDEAKVDTSTFYQGWIYATKNEALQKQKALKNEKTSALVQEIVMSVDPWAIVTFNYTSKERALEQGKTYDGIPTQILFYKGKYWISFGTFYEISRVKEYEEELRQKGVQGIRIVRTGPQEVVGYQVKVTETTQISGLDKRFLKVVTDAHASGFIQNSAAYAIDKPGHWSKFRNWFSGSLEGTRESFRWKISARAFYDMAYDLDSDFFTDQVKENHQSYFIFDETYVDFSWLKMHFRVGRQHIKWGDLIGAWVGDAVSARDLRDFILPQKDLMQIPQWALMTEKYWTNTHAQLYFLPLVNVDEFGVFGSDFFPLVVTDYTGYNVTEKGREAPGVDEFGYGLKMDHTFSNGLNLGLFYTSGPHREGRYERTISGTNVTLKAKHFEVNKVGLLARKSFKSFDLRFESSYALDDKVATKDITDTDGLVDQPILDFALALDLNLYDRGQTLLQYVNRTHLDYNPSLLVDENEQFATAFADFHFDDADMSAELTLHFGVQRFDMLARPRFNWSISTDWRLSVGYDMFDGDINGLFGRHKKKDRVYSELRWGF